MIIIVNFDMNVGAAVAEMITPDPAVGAYRALRSLTIM